MTTKRISELTAAGTLLGTELLELSQLSTTVTISAGTISAAAADNSYNDSGNGFVTAGFAVGDRVKVTGFTGNTANNIAVGAITALTAGKMTIGGTDGDVIVDDAAGETVVISKWVSRRATLTDLAALFTTGLLEFKGNTDCSGNPNYPAASKGDVYVVSVAGKIGGASGTSVDVGDVFIAKADNAGGTEASVGTSWFSIEHNGVYGASATPASNTEVLTGTDASKVVTPDGLAALWEQGSDVASAATISLGEGGYFNVTGTTTITDIDFATDKAGRMAWVKFAGALTLTHNASTLILPAGASIATAAGDTACFISEGSDVVRCVAYNKANGQALASSSSSLTQGKHLVPIMAGAMTSRTTNGPSAGTSESATNKVMTLTLDYDASTAEYAQFMVPMPKSWDEGTITAQFVWTAGNTGNVVWGIQGIALSDDDAVDTAFGTAQTVTDGVTAAGDIMISGATAAVTIGGSPAQDDLVVFQVYRDAANGSDTCAVDAKLIAVRLFMTLDAGNDA